MSVVLAPDLERIIQSKVTTGLYPSPSEVVRAALRLLEAHDELARRKQENLQRDLETGLEALERGEKRAGSEVFVAIQARHLARQEATD